MQAQFKLTTSPLVEHFRIFFQLLYTKRAIFFMRFSRKTLGQQLTEIEARFSWKSWVNRDIGHHNPDRP